MRTMTSWAMESLARTHLSLLRTMLLGEMYSRPWSFKSGFARTIRMARILMSVAFRFLQGTIPLQVKSRHERGRPGTRTRHLRTMENWTRLSGFSRLTGWAIQRYARMRYSMTSMTVYELMDAPCPSRTHLDVTLKQKGMASTEGLKCLRLLEGGSPTRSWPRNLGAVVKFKTANV